MPEQKKFSILLQEGAGGAQWRDLPEVHGKWNTIFKQFARWSDKGIWDELLAQNNAEAVIPAKKNRLVQREIDWHLYKARHLIECFMNKIKHY